MVFTTGGLGLGVFRGGVERVRERNLGFTALGSQVLRAFGTRVCGLLGPC